MTTLPFPEPEAPPVTVIHSLFDTAVHVQPTGAVTGTEALPEALPTGRSVAPRPKEQGTGACVTVAVCPAMVTLPVRWMAAGFGAKLRVTLPFPEPLAPAVTAIHSEFEDAVHAQPAGAVTITAPLPAPLSTDRFPALRAKEHAAGAWVTVTVCPAIATLPVRCMAAGFAAKCSDTLPLPEPESSPHNVIQSAPEDAAQLQPVGAVTDMEPLLEPLPTDRFEALRLKEHVTGACVTVTVCPAMVTVPVRCMAVGFEEKVRDTFPLPEPEAFPTTEIHSVPDDAVQLQPAGAVTDTDALPEPLPTDRLVALSAKEQATGAWITVTVCPAIVTVPVR